MRRRLAIFGFVVLAAYWAALFVATHTPDVEGTDIFNHADKVAHACAYAILAWLGAMVLRILHWPTLAICVTVFLVCTTYGAVDEWLQQYADRHANPWDWIADVVGTVLGLAIFLLTHNEIRNDYTRFVPPKPDS